jgi:hypothetical protein
MIADLQSSCLQESDRHEMSLRQLKRQIARGVRYFWTRQDKPWRLAAAEPQDIGGFLPNGSYYNFGLGRVHEKKKAA